MTSTVIDAGDDLPLTLGALSRRQARTLGEHLFLVCDDVRLSYAQADVRSRRLARGLLAAGVRKGSHVALLYPYGAEFVIGMLAAARIGAVVLPLSTLSTADELRGLLRNSDAGYLLATAAFRSHRFTDVLQKAFPELDCTRPPPIRSVTAPWLRKIWFSGSIPEGSDVGWSIDALESSASTVDETYLDAVEQRVGPADRLAIIHTSGSTGAPKGVIHTHGSLLRTLNNINEIRAYGSDQVLFGTAPWFWVAGFSWSLLASFLAGARVVATNATATGDILDFLERERPTFTLGYAQTIARLTADPTYPNRDFSSVRRGNLWPILAPDIRPRDPSLRHTIYGMTEVGGSITLCPDESDLPERLRGSGGKVLPGFEAKIVDAETGKQCATGELGELWIRGAFMMEGYYGKHRSEVFEPDGWWRTADVGAFDSEGFFYLKGRMGDMIKTAGANVAPREVEAALSPLVDGVQSIVLGLPDNDRGQIVAAAVITDGDIDETGLKRGLAEKLSSYKVPRHIIPLKGAELPLLSTGKVDMRKLMALVQERCSKRPG
jgi:acyl-CoA synthetase (AMP-forming)/AMP-acid ligase II